MTNLEWLFKEKKEELIQLLSHSTWCINKENKFMTNCSDIPCVQCKCNAQGFSCALQRKEWLNAEHEEPLLFPIGTPVEVLIQGGERDLQYYNGVFDNHHFCTHFYSYIGETLSNGMPRGLAVNVDSIRKVGDSNA